MGLSSQTSDRRDKLFKCTFHNLVELMRKKCTAATWFSCLMWQNKTLIYQVRPKQKSNELCAMLTNGISEKPSHCVALRNVTNYFRERERERQRDEEIRHNWLQQSPLPQPWQKCRSCCCSAVMVAGCTHGLVSRLKETPKVLQTKEPAVKEPGRVEKNWRADHHFSHCGSCLKTGQHSIFVIIYFFTV